jgi:hypothetical protein
MISEHLPKIKTEPGQKLAERLGQRISEFMKVFGAVSLVLFWNGIVSVFV